MNNTQLRTRLRSVGMKDFVKHLDLAEDNVLSNEEAAAILQKREGHQSNSCLTKISHVRAIVRAGQKKPR